MSCHIGRIHLVLVLLVDMVLRQKIVKGANVTVLRWYVVRDTSVHFDSAVIARRVYLR